MPPATPATKVSLRELADLAIGTPEVGAVNFTALHTLIVAMLKNLNLQETVIDFHTLSPKGGRSVEALQAPSRSTLSSAPQLHHSKDQHKTASRSSSHALGSQVEELGSQVKELGSQVEGLTKQLKTVDSQMQVIAAQVQQITSTSTELGFEAPTVLEVKNMSMPDTEEAQIRSTEVQEDVRKPMNLLHDVVEDVKILKEAYQKAQELKPQEVFQRIEKLEKLIKERDDFLEYMGQKLTLVPSGEEVTMVTWEELEEAIANGWKASQVGSETALGLSKRKVQSSLTSSDLIQSGVSTKYTSTDHIPDSAGGPRQPLPGSSATGHLYEAVTIKQRGKGSFAPGREQHTRARAEANASRFYQPSIPQFRTESDHHRSREQFTSGYPRRDIHTGPAQQDLPLARDQPIGQGQVYVRPDHHELGLPGIDQLGLPYASTTLPGVVPISVSQLGMLPPQMDCQGLEPLGMDQRGVVPPLVPGRDQQRSGLPGTDQLGVVPLSPYQYGMIIPGTDQCSMKQPGMPESGMRPLGIDQHGFVTLGVNQGGLVPPGGVQQGLEPSGIDQHGLSPVPIDRHGLVSPGLIQVNADQQGFVQPSLETSGFIQPGTEQHDLIWPDRNQSTLGQPGTYRPGLAQPGAEQHGLVQPGEHPPDLVQPGKDQDSLIQPGLDQRRLIQPGTVQHGLTQPGVAQLDVAQHGADQHGLVHPEMGRHDLMQPGTFPSSWVQPGAYPPAWAQAGADSHRPVQPGIGQHGFVQPRMDQSDVVQLGADQQGSVQPGADQQGSVQPGADQQGSVQPGADQQGSVLLVPPGMDQRGLVQPGMDQHGWRQPSADHQSLIVPGTELCRFPPFQADLRSLRSPHPYPYPRGMVPPGQEQHGRLSPFLASQASSSPRTDKESIRPDQQYLVSPGPDQQAQIYPGAVQPGQEHPVWDQQGPGYSGYGGPGSLGVDPRGRVALDPNRIPDFPAQTESDQDATSDRSQDSLSFLHQVSSERSEPRSGTQSEQRNSLEKLAPNFPMALETFRLMGELIGLYVELKENLKDLDEEKAGQTDREKIQYLFTLMVKKILLPDLQEQMKTLKALPKEVHQEKAKVEKVQRLLEGDGEQVAGEELKAGQLALQLGLLRITVTDIEKELADLRDSQEQGKAAMENSVAEASLYLQDQLDKLRTIMESMLASSSTLLSLSITPHKPLTILAPSQIHPEATCPACSLDLSHQVSTLVQRYEQLQEMVSNLAASRPSRKAKLQSQDEELLGHVQSAILQVQGDCEKLNITTSNLIEDHWQKQKDIDVLYQRLEKLEKEKANRKHLQMEIEVKADKSALASKVSRVQLDATTEQLNHMMQELMAKMSGQEQDWQKLLDKLLAEMDMKLDRLELDPVKQALEDRWKSLREQLKERSPLYQADEAAAMRRQLLAHFHCLSCDRPLETPVTGRIIPVTPVGHALPGHRSIRPYTVFELEQVRQQSRNLKLGSTFLPRGDQSAMEQSVGRLRTMHSKMLWDIEKVQIHFGGSVKTSSQMIRQLLQAHCLSSPCYKRGPNSADHTCSTMARRCGGSHTVTYPYRRNRLQHPSQALYAPEEIRIAMKHAEVDLLGLDGHIYKGRMDTRLPGILTKDISSQYRQGRPVSSVGRLAQSDMAHPPSPNLQGSLPGLEVNMDMPPGEGLKEPTRGPRSTTAQGTEV